MADQNTRRDSMRGTLLFLLAIALMVVWFVRGEIWWGVAGMVLLLPSLYWLARAGRNVSR
jgi:hypothetical protein